MKNIAMEQRLKDEILSFIDSRRSLQLASIGEDGYPFASYAPFASDADAFYILLSDIAIHGVNLARDSRASVLIVEDEDTAGELYARIRVNYQVDAEQLEVGSPDWERGVSLLEARHGQRPRNLSGLQDFRLFRLHPRKGRYIKGFGKAYTLEGGTIGGTNIDHLREGHKPREEAAA
ncbi:MAG: heme utilization protein HutZ [Congregibacter sp.]